MKVHKQTAEWKTLGQKEFRTRCVHEHIKNTARCALRTPSAGSTRERTVELWKVYARRRLAVTISDRNSWSLGDIHSLILEIPARRSIWSGSFCVSSFYLFWNELKGT